MCSVDSNCSLLVAVNNAGLVFGNDAVGKLNLDEVEVMLSTNVFAVIHLTQLFINGE